jgi:hypothetical protein
MGVDFSMCLTESLMPSFSDYSSIFSDDDTANHWVWGDKALAEVSDFYRTLHVRDFGF